MAVHDWQSYSKLASVLGTSPSVISSLSSNRDDMTLYGIVPIDRRAINASGTRFEYRVSPRFPAKRAIEVVSDRRKRVEAQRAKREAEKARKISPKGPPPIEWLSPDALAARLGCTAAEVLVATVDKSMPARGIYRIERDKTVRRVRVRVVEVIR